MFLTTLNAMQNKNTIKQFAWLEGEWKMNGKEAFEVWQIESDTALIGGAFHLEGKDYVRDERIALIAKEDGLYYIPTVENQNDGLPVEFKIITQTQNSFLAENKAHNYPQQIGYELTGADNLHAYISGNTRGKHKQIDFYYTRTK